MSTPLWPARLHHLRRDSAQPERLARFYGELLGDSVEALPDAQWLVQGHGRRLVVGKGARGAVPYFALAMRDAAQLADYAAALERLGVAREPSPSPLFAEKHDLVICSDEIHADILLDEGKPHVPIASVSREASRRTVTLISPNKTFGFPGAGCAFAIIEEPELRRAFSADHHATVHDPSVFGYEAALAAYRECGGWLEAQLAYLRANRDLVEREVAAMRGLKMAHVEATYLAWIDATGLGVTDPYEHFLKNGVALSPGAQFGAPGFVRLNFGTQRTVLEQALIKISSASRQSPRG